MSVELPVLAYFDTPKTRKSNGLSSLFQNRVYFEIWNIEKNNSIFTIKFYDKIRGMTYLENFKLYAFGKLLTDIKVNFKKYINIIYKDENYELETIVNHNYWKNNETYSLLCKNIKSKNHENLCTLFKTSDKDYTPRLFHKLTGKLSKLKKNTFHDKTLLDAIKMV